MDTVIDILEALERDNSRTFKEDLLRKHRHNELLKRVFVATSDPYRNYYVNKLKMPPVGVPSQVSIDDDEFVEGFLDLLEDQLATRKLTGNAAKDAVVAKLASMDTERCQKWCLRILLRNLRVGVMETTINKTWPGAIAKFSVALAETLTSTFDPKDGLRITGKVDYPVRVEPKLDGLRCIAVKVAGEVTMYTRSGSVIETLPTVKAALEAADWDDFVLDGEAMGADWNESASVVMSRKTAKDDSGIVYNVFDAMAFDEWRDQECPTELTDRVELAAELVKQVGSKCVQHVPGQTVKSEKELKKFYSGTMGQGYEGIMVKRLSAPYRFKRTDAVMKLKPVTTYEGIVVGHYEGKRGSKREGLWGGFDVLLPNGVVTHLGGGFSDKLKAEIGVDPDSWIGEVVEMEGQPDPLTADGLTADGRIRFPVFVRKRDKRDVDPKIHAAHKKWLGMS